MAASIKEAMNQVKAASSGWKAYGLVRDKDGTPVIDDPETLPQQIKDMLTDEEYLKIYGTKRI